MQKKSSSSFQTFIRKTTAWLNLNLSILLTIVVVSIMAYSQTTPYMILNPVPILQFLVIVSVFSSNFFRSATISLVISLSYAAVYYSDPNHIFFYSPDNVKRLLVVFVILPLTILLVAILNRRNNMLLEERIEKDKEVEHQSQIVAILESISDAFFALDKELRFTYVNKQADKFFYGLSKDELMGKPLVEVMPEIKKTRTLRKIRQALAMGKSFHFDDYFFKRGSYYLFNVYPSKAGVSVYFKDITQEKKEAENMIRLGEAVQNAEDAIFSSTPDGVIISWNEGAAKTYGYSEREIIGKHSLILYPEDKKSEFHQMQSKILRGKSVKRLETVRLRKDGRRVQVSLTKTPVQDQKGNIIAIAAVARDISLRKKIEQELRQSRDQLEIIFKNVADGITVQNKEGLLIYVNDAAAKLMGFESASEIVQSVKKYGQEHFRKTGLSRFELKDELGKPLEYSELPAYIALHRREHAERLIQYYDRKKKKTLWSQVKASPILDEAGQVIYAVNVFNDVTKQKELERRKDEFLSIASHELKTPITSIKGFAYLLDRLLRKTNDEKAINYVSKINLYTDKITGLINDLLDITKIQTGQLQFHEETFDFDEMVREVVEDMRATTDTHKIILSGKTESTFTGDRNRLEQVVVNLLSNAVKYSPNADKVKITIRKSGGQIKVAVTDFGIGIPKHKVTKIFERFYRVDETASQFSGLGIGLYISRGIIIRHGGTIWAESNYGKGSTFAFSLPVKKPTR